MPENETKKQENKKTEKEQKAKKTVIKRKFKGVVASDKMEKTIVVKVERTKVHPRYKKRYTVSRKYKVHDEKNQYKTGDKVTIVECRPISKHKRWRAT